VDNITGSWSNEMINLPTTEMKMDKDIFSRDKSIGLVSENEKTTLARDLRLQLP